MGICGREEEGEQVGREERGGEGEEGRRGGGRRGERGRRKRGVRGRGNGGKEGRRGGVKGERRGEGVGAMNEPIYFLWNCPHVHCTTLTLVSERGGLGGCDACEEDWTLATTCELPLDCFSGRQLVPVAFTPPPSFNRFPFTMSARFETPSSTWFWGGGAGTGAVVPLSEDVGRGGKFAGAKSNFCCDLVC